MDLTPRFHLEFLLQERRAILQRWVADQMEGPSLGSWGVASPVPLVGYSSEFLDRFVDDLVEHRGDRIRDWLQGVVAESVLDEITASSLAFFVVTLRRAIASLWTLEAASPRPVVPGDGWPELPTADMGALVEIMGALDAILLDGLAMLERQRAADPAHALDSLEFLRPRPAHAPLDSIDLLDSVEIAPPGPCTGGMRNMAGHLRSFLVREGGTPGEAERRCEEGPPTSGGTGSMEIPRP